LLSFIVGFTSLGNCKPVSAVSVLLFPLLFSSAYFGKLIYDDDDDEKFSETHFA